MSETTTGEEASWDLVSAYSRAQAIEDGVLVDLTEWASAKTGMICGFSVPVAVTAAVWADIEAIPDQLRQSQDVRGRAHDVLWMARCAAARSPEETDRIGFQVHMPVAGDLQETRSYWMVTGPGDEGEPVITIMALGED